MPEAISTEGRGPCRVSSLRLMFKRTSFAAVRELIQASERLRNLVLSSLKEQILLETNELPRLAQVVAY